MDPASDPQELTPTEQQLALQLDLLGWAVPSAQFQIAKFTGTVDPKTVPRNRDRSRDRANAQRGVMMLPRLLGNTKSFVECLSASSSTLHSPT
ncbi:MAG: hypothetical protein ACO4AI_04825 [Prochlorothrix sp.]